MSILWGGGWLSVYLHGLGEGAIIVVESVK